MNGNIIIGVLRFIMNQCTLYRVHNCIATGLASRLVDPDGQYRQVVDKQQLTGSPSRWILPTDGWTTNLEELPQFSYGNIFAHLVSNSKTVASNQKSLQAVTEEQIRVPCTSLESHQKSSPFSKLLRGNDCKPLTESTTITVSEIPNAISDAEQCTSIANDNNTQLSRNDTILINDNISQSKCDTQINTDTITNDEAHNNACNGVNSITTPEEAVIAHITVTQEQAKNIEIETMEQSHSEAWFKERQWRITASYFGRVCKMRKSTSRIKLANTITTQCQRQLIPLTCSWGKNNEPIAVAATFST